MVNKRGELIEKAKLILSIIFLISTFALIAYFVFAAMGAPTLQSPASGSNNSTTMNFSCKANIDVAVNATILYNASGGAATAVLRVLTNDTEYSGADQANVTGLTNASLNVTSLANSRQYNITCKITNLSSTGNTTGSIYYASSVNVTIDNTPPVVGAFTNVVSGGNYSNTTLKLVINVSVIDATTEIQYVYINVSNMTGNVGKEINATLNFSRAINASSAQYFNYTLNITRMGEGRYNITAHANDTLNNTNNAATTRIQITVDNTRPNASVTIASLNNSNKSGNFNINVTTTDAFTGVRYVNFTIKNATGEQLLNLTAALLSGNIWGVDIITNASFFTDGNYTINASVYDYAGNVNSSAANITFILDNTIPTITFTCSPATVYTGATETCTCTAADATSAIDNSTLTYTASPSTAQTGSFTKTCTAYDYAGNFGSASASFNVISSGSGPGGSSSSTTPVVITTVGTLTNEQLASGYSKDLSKGQQVGFKVSNTNHYAGVLAITTTTALINVSSASQQKSLSVGDEWKVELTGDNFNDLSVKLNSIASSKANLTIKSIHELITTTTTPETTPSTTTQVAEAVKSNLTTIIIIVIIVVIVAVVIFFLYKRKK